MEAQSAELAVRLVAARDVMGVEAAHAAFLDACCQQCFLDSQPLAQALQALYALCMRICVLISQVGTLPMHAPAFPPYLLHDGCQPTVISALWVSPSIATDHLRWPITACQAFSAILHYAWEVPGFERMRCVSPWPK